MSDYVHQKVIRMKIDCEKLGINDAYDLENREELSDLFKPIRPDKSKKAHFEIGVGDNYKEGLVHYLDYVFYDDYGNGSMNCGFSRYITDEEAEKYLPLFKKVNEDVTKDDLRFVEYFYYNCCEPDNYFEVGFKSETERDCCYLEP